MSEATLFDMRAGSAHFSACGRYRYELWRHWTMNRREHYAMFIGLNPSTADAENDDPTIRRCIQFAKDWGYDSLCMTNLFAWRATLPRDMKAAAEPVGELNDLTLLRLAKGAGVVVACWGKDGAFRGRAATMCQSLPALHCLALNKDRSPGHPLYLRGDLKPVPYAP